jgi:hypothetical protein
VSRGEHPLQRLNPAHRIYGFPLDTTDEATLDAMTSYATHWMHNDAAPQLESLCATLRELDRASQANEK